MAKAGQSYLTDPAWLDKIDQLIGHLRKGHHIVTACKRVGLTKKTFYQWLEDARKGKSTEHVEFARRVDEAMADFEMGLIESIMKIGKEDKVWTALAWIAERRFAERWAQQQHIKVVQEVTNQVETILKNLEKILPPDQYARVIEHLALDSEERENFVNSEMEERDEGPNDFEVSEDMKARIQKFGGEQ